jgi:hypothetical protein
MRPLGPCASIVLRFFSCSYCSCGLHRGDLRRLDVALACRELFRGCDAKTDYLSLLTVLFLDADPGNHPDSAPRAPPQGAKSANTRGVFSNGYANGGKGPDLAKEEQKRSVKCPAFGFTCPAVRMCGLSTKFFQTRVFGLGTEQVGARHCARAAVFVLGLPPRIRNELFPQRLSINICSDERSSGH